MLWWFPSIRIWIGQQSILKSSNRKGAESHKGHTCRIQSAPPPRFPLILTSRLRVVGASQRCIVAKKGRLAPEQITCFLAGTQVWSRDTGLQFLCGWIKTLHELRWMKPDECCDKAPTWMLSIHSMLVRGIPVPGVSIGSLPSLLLSYGFLWLVALFL